jgi:hypothetical protein
MDEIPKQSFPGLGRQDAKLIAWLANGGRNLQSSSVT